MDLNTISDLVSKLGLGVASFIALLYGGNKLLNWLEEIRTNHLPHIQQSLDQLTKNSTDANAKLDEQTRKLDELLKK